MATWIAASLSMQGRAEVSSQDRLSGVVHPLGLQLGRERNGDGSWNNAPKYQVVDDAIRFHLHFQADGAGRWNAWVARNGDPGENTLALREVDAARMAEIVG